MGTVWSCLLAAASLHSVPACCRVCTLLKIQSVLQSVRERLAVCSVFQTPVTHCDLRSRGTQELWAQPPAKLLSLPLSLCLVVFLSSFSYLLLIVHVIVHLMVCPGTYYILGCLCGDPPLNWFCCWDLIL